MRANHVGSGVWLNPAATRQENAGVCLTIQRPGLMIGPCNTKPIWVSGSPGNRTLEEISGISKPNVIKAKGIFFTGGLRGVLFKH